MHFQLLETKFTVHHCSQDPQPLYSEKILKMGSTVLFTHLKIILLQCFQFSVLAKIKLYPNGPLENFFDEKKFEVQ